MEGKLLNVLKGPVERTEFEFEMYYLQHALIMAKLIGWTSVNILYFPDSIKIASLEGLTLWCSLTYRNGYWHDDARFSWLEDNDLVLPMRYRIGRGDNSQKLGYGMCHFLRVLFG